MISRKERREQILDAGLVRACQDGILSVTIAQMTHDLDIGQTTVVRIFKTTDILRMTVAIERNFSLAEAINELADRLTALRRTEAQRIKLASQGRNRAAPGARQRRK